jgi:hypothetical protein
VVGMYDSEMGQRLQVSGEGIQAGTDMILLTEIQVVSSVGELSPHSLGRGASGYIRSKRSICWL